MRWILLSVFTGWVAGSAAAIFLHLLSFATQTRASEPLLMWGLPLVGLLTGWMYHRYGKEIEPGTNLILDEIHDPRKTIPLRMTPLILGSTVLAHLVGASVGREGTVVQMGASLADQVARIFRVNSDERKFLLMAGLGAGFGAALGAPWAGMIFGMEVLQGGRLRWQAFLECAVSSFTACGIAVLLKAPHSFFSELDAEFSWTALLAVAIASIGFGIAVRIFIALTHFTEQTSKKWIRSPILRPLAGGFLLLVLFLALPLERYASLGLPAIHEALARPVGFADPIWKMILTGLSVGTGFKGGEFVPLVFIGSSFGSALAVFLPVSVEVLASAGFAAMFAGAAKTPFACAVLSIELFGWKSAPYAFVACFICYLCSGRRGLYRAQRRIGFSVRADG